MSGTPAARRLNSTEAAAIAIPLRDSGAGGRRADAALGLVTAGVQLALWLVAGLLLVLAAVPASVSADLLGRIEPLAGERRLAFAVGGIALAAVARALHGRSAAVLEWSRLPADGTLFVERDGIRLRHPAVLDGDVSLPWRSIRAVALDSGIHHDGGGHWRRFPIGRDGSRRHYVFDTDGDARPSLALIASRPIAPNVAILLREPVPVSNPNAASVEAAFAPSAGRGMPAVPPGERSLVRGLLLSVGDLRATRDALRASGVLRHLRPDDVAALEEPA